MSHLYSTGHLHTPLYWTWTLGDDLALASARYPVCGVCVCVEGRERKRETGRETWRERGREREREREMRERKEGWRGTRREREIEREREGLAREIASKRATERERAE